MRNIQMTLNKQTQNKLNMKRSLDRYLHRVFHKITSENPQPKITAFAESQAPLTLSNFALLLLSGDHKYPSNISHCVPSRKHRNKNHCSTEHFILVSF